MSVNCIPKKGEAVPVLIVPILQLPFFSALVGCSAQSALRDAKSSTWWSFDHEVEGWGSNNNLVHAQTTGMTWHRMTYCFRTNWEWIGLVYEILRILYRQEFYAEHLVTNDFKVRRFHEIGTSKGIPHNLIATSLERKQADLVTHFPWPMNCPISTTITWCMTMYDTDNDIIQSFFCQSLSQAPVVFSFVNLCSKGNQFTNLDVWGPKLQARCQ